MVKTTKELLMDMMGEEPAGIAVVTYHQAKNGRVGLKFNAAGLPDASIGWFLVGLGEMISAAGKQCLPEQPEQEEAPAIVSTTKM